MFEGGDEFARQPPMSDQDHTDHRDPFAGRGRGRMPIAPQAGPIAAGRTRRRASSQARPVVPSAPQIKLANMESMRLRRAEATRRSRRMHWGVAPAGAWGYLGPI